MMPRILRYIQERVYEKQELRVEILVYITIKTLCCLKQKG